MNKPGASKTRGAVIVTRVSGHEQAEKGTSLESQRDACRAKAQALGLPIVAEYEDAAISGAFLLSRAGMQAALADIAAGRADTLITFNIDRYSRDREHQEQIKKAVRAAGGHLVFTDADYQDNAAGNLSFNIRGDFAVFEREHFRERSMLGKRSRIEGGNQVTRSVSPYGYHLPTKADVLRGDSPPDLLGKYVLVPDKAAVVREALLAYHSGRMTLADIVRDLNARGIPAARGGVWRVSALAFMFTNPVYKGKPVAGRWQSRKDEGRLLRENKHTGKPLTSTSACWLAPEENWIPLDAPALVSEDVWAGVQRRLAENKAKQGGNARRVRLLSGRVICPDCGGRMECTCTGGARGAWSAAYVCRTHAQARRTEGRAVCAGTRYPVPVMEEAAIAAMLDACTRPDMIAAALAEYARAQAEPAASADPRKELAALDKALAELAQEDLLAVQAQIAGMKVGASPDAYAAVFADLAARRKDLEDRRGVLKGLLGRSAGTAGAKGGEAKQEEVQRLALEDARLVLTSPLVPADQKRRILGTMVDHVIPRPAEGGQPASTDVYWIQGFFDTGEDDGETLQNMLTLQPRQLEGMIHESGLTPPQVMGILTLLEMRGLAKRVPGNAFVRVL